MDLLALLQQYARIALMMGKPQDLPAGTGQLHIAIVLSIVTYVLALASSRGVGVALLQACIEIGLSGLFLWVGLSLVNRTARFAQAFGGLCGAYAMLQIVAIPILMTGNVNELTPMVAFPRFFLLVWNLSIVGYVVRHTFEIGIFASIGVAFVFYLLMSAILEMLFPTAASQMAFLQASGAWVV